jgi:SAM-dependent methyltransferase
VTLELVDHVIGRAKTGVRHLIGEIMYERRYHVRTSGLVMLDTFGLANDERVYYIAASWHTLRLALSRESVTDRDVFIDLGCGMGRMVLEAAARYPFRRVIGVELSEQLVEIARLNVALTTRRQRSGRIELVCSDVLEYQIPDDVTVVFMNNPFRGPVFKHVVDELVRSLRRDPRSIRIIYSNPAEGSVLESAGFRRIRAINSRPADFPFGMDTIELLYKRNPL